MENPTTTPQTPNPVAATAKWYTNPDNLLKIFQVILGVSTLFYIAGYLSWAAFAYHNGLGFLPALREQYVIAGIVPVVLVITLITVLIFTIKLAPHTEFSTKITWANVQLITIITVVIVLIIVNQGRNGNIPKNISDILAPVLGYIGIAVALFALYNIKHDKDLELVYLQRKVQVVLSLIIITIMVFYQSFQHYNTNYFPHLPREFGGPKAEPYTFDVNRTELSDKTLSMICEDDWVAANNGQNVYSTDTLYLIFDSDEYLLLKKYDRDLGKDNPLIKLKTSFVRAQFPLR